MNRLLSLFSPPKYSDLERTQKAASLHYTYLVIAPAFLIFGFLNIGWEAYELGNTLIAFGGVCIAGLFLNRIRIYYPSAILLSGIVFAGTIYNLVDGAAFHDPGVAALPIFVLFTGIFFRKKHVPILAGLSILALIGIYFLYQNGTLELSTPPTQGRLIILCILQVISGALTWMIISTYQKTISNLNISEDRYHDLVESLQDLIYRYELLPEPGFTFVSLAATEITGYTPEEFYEDPHLGLKLIHPEEREEFSEITSGQGQLEGTHIFRWIKKDGTVIWAEQRNNPIRDENGNLVAIEVIARDITDLKTANDALRNSAERNRAFFEESPLLNWQYTLDPPMPIDLPIDKQIDWILHKSILTDINVEFALTSRPAEGEVIGQTLFMSWGESDVIGKPITRDFITNQYSLSMYETMEETIEDPVWSILNAFGVVEEGHLVRLWGTTLDITERKLTELELRESDIRNRLILNTLPMAFYRALPDGDISGTWVSDQIDQISGFSAKDMTAPGFWSDQLHPEDRQRSIQAFNDLNPDHALDIEYRWKRKDGEYIWIKDNAVLITNEFGDPMEIIGTWTDITERKLAEESLRRSEERYRTLFMSAAEGISIHAGDTYIDVNKAWEDMFGYNKNEVLGNTPFDYSPQVQPNGRISSEIGWDYIRAAQAGEAQLFTWRHIHSDGTEFDAEIFMTIIELANEEVMISFVRDLTKRKEAEAAALEERQRLAHELHDAVSQTLFSASMIAQTLERNWEKNPEMVRDNLSELQILTQGALAEMRNLLVELRPGSLEHTPMPELLQQLVNGFSGRTKTSITLDIQDHNPLPSEVRFVFFRLAQESLNNIIKHARANQVKVIYSSQPGQALLTIDDDGQGFNPAAIDSGHHGLEIMKERAEKINADINIKSKVGKGTSISVSWKP